MRPGERADIFRAAHKMGFRAQFVQKIVYNFD